jgi:hypothetical protein
MILFNAVINKITFTKKLSAYSTTLIVFALNKKIQQWHSRSNQNPKGNI